MRSNMPRRHGSLIQTSCVLATLSLSILGGFQAAPAFAQDAPAGTEQTITVDLREVALTDAVNALTQRVGLNNIVIETVPGKSFNPVTLKLVDQPVRVALKAIAKSAGGVLTQEDGIYYLRPKTDGDAVATPAPKPSVPPVASTVENAVAAPRRHSSRDTQIASIKLNYMVPSDFVALLDDPKFLRLSHDDSMFQKHIPQAAAFNPGSGQFAPQVLGTPANSSTTGNTTQAPAAPAGTGKPVTGDTGSAGRDGDAFTQGQFGVGGGGAGGFGQPGGGPGGAGQPGQGGRQGGVTSLKPDGVQQVISNDADNSLLVEYDDIEDLNRLREIVRLLDVAPKQVLIKAEFVNVSVQDADSFGISWRFQPAANIDVQLPAQSASGTPSLLMAYASGNAVANLLAEVSHNTSNILQAPMISTINNKSASISVDSIVSIAQTVVIPVLNGPSITATQQVPVDASNGLTVLPHINGDNSISLALQPQLQTVTVRADGGYDSTNESLTTYRRVQNGETMVLGGFINKTDTLNIQRVPLLSDLPIIGNLFTQRDHSIQGGEVLVFITPTIIEDRAQGVVGTTGTGGGGVAP